MQSTRPMRVVHCVRAPIGGIFRHILDLAHEQARNGLEVGLILDSKTGGDFESRKIAEASGDFKLGIVRFPIPETPGPGDIPALFRMIKCMADMRPDVMHAHGSKGGVLGRLSATLLRLMGRKIVRFYCPHGGMLHFSRTSLKGRVFFFIERMMEKITDSLIFVGDYEMRAYGAKVGHPQVPWGFAYNGLRASEFEPVAPKGDGSIADFLYIGMMRDIKGTDVFIKAIANLHANGFNATAHMVGDGPDRLRYQNLSIELGLEKYITFHDPMPARQAFSLARTNVVPSRAESMPYIVLETIAAQMPLIATSVGGIPEIFANHSKHLIPPGNVEALSIAMQSNLDDQDSAADRAISLSIEIRSLFSVEVMTSHMSTLYERALLNCRMHRNSLTPIADFQSEPPTDANRSTMR